MKPLKFLSHIKISIMTHLITTTHFFILMTSWSLLFSLHTSPSPVTHTYIQTIQCHHTHWVPLPLAPPTMFLLLLHGHDLSLTLVLDNREMSLHKIIVIATTITFDQLGKKQKRKIVLPKMYYVPGKVNSKKWFMLIQLFISQVRK